MFFLSLSIFLSTGEINVGVLTSGFRCGILGIIVFFFKHIVLTVNQNLIVLHINRFLIIALVPFYFYLKDLS